MLFQIHRFGSSRFKRFPDDDAARAYLRKLNEGVTRNLWVMRKIVGPESRDASRLINTERGNIGG